MSHQCYLTGKKMMVVNRVTRRGKARREGGVGRKTTGITKRVQKPNLQPLTVVRGGVAVQMRVCNKCRKSLI